MSTTHFVSSSIATAHICVWQVTKPGTPLTPVGLHLHGAAEANLEHLMERCVPITRHHARLGLVKRVDPSETNAAAMNEGKAERNSTRRPSLQSSKLTRRTSRHTHFCGPSASPGRCFVSSLGEIMSKMMGASGMKPPSAGVDGGVGGATGVEFAGESLNCVSNTANGRQSKRSRFLLAKRCDCSPESDHLSRVDLGCIILPRSEASKHMS